ncbi:hypothetical protein BG011_008826 [Mortierella polycephala]|uniref:SET domain-containing protein n=1 Tax=Mortierella polycephala TaxID=41804 RepID=A0A9P6QC52_9FUNG|nr:hypothetical protein BG011_008826 [Mortierella polycephala]
MQEQEPEQNQDKDQQQHVSTIDPGLLPVNWPKHVKYLVDYEYHPLIPAEVLDLVQGRRRKMSDYQSTATSGLGSGSGSESDNVPETQQQQQQWNENPPRTELELQYDDIPIGHAIPGILRTPTTTSSSPSSSVSSPPFSPSPPSASSFPPSSLSCPSALHPHQQQLQTPYEIRLITNPPTHPVLGSYGLFATTTLRPGLHLLDYISIVVPDAYADPDSDHTLYLSNDLNLDASAHGNHGRFVNDFRRIRTQEQGPNVSWDLYRDAETGQIRMGCKVLKRIRPGEEILCTYGKSYWRSRGIMVKGKEWEDDWDTDLDDQSDDEEDEEDEEDDDGI